MSADGTWTLTLNTPMGAQQGTLNLKTNGGTLEGTMIGPQGEVPLENGKVDGSTLSWSINAVQMAMVIHFTAALDGDKISGEAELGTFGKATFEGARA